MEESEKRRERLKAIRMEAAQAEGRNSNINASPVPCLLSNPLLGTSAALPGQDDSSTAPRFDYYTDPMAAFSGNHRRRSNVPQEQFTPPRPRNLHFQRNHPPPEHFGPSFPPDQTMYVQSPHYNSGPQMSPQMTTPQHFGSNILPDHTSCSQGLHYGTGPPQHPGRVISPFPVHQGTPPAWSGPPRMPYNNCYSPTSSRSGNMFSPGYGRENSSGFSSPAQAQAWGLMGNSPSTGSGRGGSPSFNSGRAKGRWFANSNSPHSGRGGRGRGSHGDASALSRPELFYDKSMVDDPWRHLTPVIWGGGFLAKSSHTSWLPQSLRTKKARVFEPRGGSGLQPSLAEYLAASFNEATDDASNV